MTFSIRMQLTPFADSLDMQVHTDMITFHSMYYTIPTIAVLCKCFSCSRGSFIQPILLDRLSCYSPQACLSHCTGCPSADDEDPCSHLEDVTIECCKSLYINIRSISLSCCTHRFSNTLHRDTCWYMQE